MANSLAVLRACRGFSLDQLRYEYPDEVLELGRTAQETMAGRVSLAVIGRWLAGAPPDIARRIAHELRLIGERGYGTR